MSDELVQSDAPAPTPVDESAPDLGSTTEDQPADPSLTTELIERQIERAIDAAYAVAEAVDVEVEVDADETDDFELVGDFDAPDQETIDNATRALAAMQTPSPPRDDPASPTVTVTEAASVPREEPSLEDDVSEPTEAETLEPRASEPAAGTPVEAVAEETEPDESIEQIDAMLAEMAEGDFEGKLAGDFQTVDQVIAGDGAEAGFETAEQVIGPQSDPPVVSDSVVTAPSTPTPAGNDKSATGLEGSFDSLEDVFGGQLPETPAPEPQGNAAVETIAADPVAATSPVMSTPPEVPVGVKAGEDRANPSEPPEMGARARRLRELLVNQARQLERRALNGCGRINHPMRFVHPEMRDTVGWVALAVAVPGVVFFTLGLIF